MEFELADLNGRAHHLTEFAGQVVLIDFWATWCEPCATLLPIYQSWQDAWGDRGFVVVSVNVDEEEERVREFARLHAPGLLVLMDPAAHVAAQFGFTAMPAAYVFDRDGRLVMSISGEGVEALRTQIEKLLGVGRLQ